MKAPIRLAIVNDYAVVVAGVAALLTKERIDVVETAAGLPVITDVDVVLYDTFSQVHGQGLDLEDFVRDSGAKVVIYTWNLRPELIERAIAEGASGYLSKVLRGPVIVEALERIMSGEIVVLAGDDETSVGGPGDWPGRFVGLSPREAEVVALIARGLSNQEIAERAHVSINSIKTYIRSAYQKIGVERRTQVVLWALANGFVPDTERTIDASLRLRPEVPVHAVLAASNNTPEPGRSRTRGTHRARVVRAYGPDNVIDPAGASASGERRTGSSRSPARPPRPSRCPRRAPCRRRWATMAAGRTADRRA